MVFFNCTCFYVIFGYFCGYSWVLLRYFFVFFFVMNENMPVPCFYSYLGRIIFLFNRKQRCVLVALIRTVRQERPGLYCYIV
jgi:hypothetical protein